MSGSGLLQDLFDYYNHKHLYVNFLPDAAKEHLNENNATTVPY